MAKRPLSIVLAKSGTLAHALRKVRTPDWSSARCLNSEPELFFSEDAELKAIAKALCVSCPISELCAEWAAHNASDGIFGGLTPKERQLKFGFSPLSPSDDVEGEYQFLMKATLGEISVKYGINQRTAIRWRKDLYVAKEAM